VVVVKITPKAVEDTTADRKLYVVCSTINSMKIGESLEKKKY
jgi:hypothetical protein